MSAPRTRLRWNVPELWCTAIVTALLIGLAAAAIYGGPA